MSVELSVAVVTALFTLVLVLLFALGAIAPMGMATIMGNRENVPPVTGWVGRAQRAHANALENLAPFAVIAIAIQIAGASNGLSQTAALVFLAARLVHGIAYLLGIKGVRTLAWNIGFAATFATALPLLGLVKL